MRGDHSKTSACSRSIRRLLVSGLVGVALLAVASGCTIHRYTMSNKTPADARDAIVIVRPVAKPVPLDQFPDRFEEKGPTHVVIPKGTRIIVSAAPSVGGFHFDGRPVIACGHAADGSVYVCRNRADASPWRIPPDKLRQLDLAPRSLVGIGSGVGAGIGAIAAIVADIARLQACSPDRFCEPTDDWVAPLAIGGGALIGAVVGGLLTGRKAYRMERGGWSVTAIR